jgi:hypothetical protein
MVSRKFGRRTSLDRATVSRASHPQGEINMEVRKNNIGYGKPVAPALPPTNRNASEQIEDCLEAAAAERAAGKEHRRALYRALQAVTELCFRAKADWGAYQREFIAQGIKITAATPEMLPFVKVITECDESTATERAAAIQYALARGTELAGVAAFLEKNGGIKGCSRNLAALRAPKRAGSPGLVKTVAVDPPQDHSDWGPTKQVQQVPEQKRQPGKHRIRLKQEPPARRHPTVQKANSVVLGAACLRELRRLRPGRVIVRVELYATWEPGRERLTLRHVIREAELQQKMDACRSKIKRRQASRC